MASIYLKTRIIEHLAVIYPDVNLDELATQIADTIGIDSNQPYTPINANLWDEKDCMLITYGDSILHENETPLQTLKNFLDHRLKPIFNAVHILPFFPYSSDDGFSVIDYKQVNTSLGNWSDIELIANDYALMSDLVINHGSSQSEWFKNFLKNESPGKDYYFSVEEDADISQVVRPRSSPLLVPYETCDGRKYLWCTFSPDQVDFDFSNPRLLLEFIRIIRLYLEKGVKIFRLDAVAFLWKQAGSPSIHLPQTHEVIQLIRTVIEHHTPDAIIITETNVPNSENLTYYGNGNEAHMVYNFSLPPLLLYSLLSGNCKHLKSWLMSMPQSPQGNCYFNFIASHDGIGLRPLDGLISEEEKQQLVDTVLSLGGRVTTRRAREGHDKPYELNIALYDACKGTIHGGEDKWQIQRFISAHTIMMSLEGMPAFYIHSLFGTLNDQAEVLKTGQNRSINRHRWNKTELDTLLDDPLSHHNRVFNTLLDRLAIRKKQPAFHPNALQFTLHLGEQILAFRRVCLIDDQQIVSLNNITSELLELNLSALNLDLDKEWRDLLTDEAFGDDAVILLRPYDSLWLSSTRLS